MRWSRIEGSRPHGHPRRIVRDGPGVSTLGRISNQLILLTLQNLPHSRHIWWRSFWATSDPPRGHAAGWAVPDIGESSAKPRFGSVLKLIGDPDPWFAGVEAGESTSRNSGRRVEPGAELGSTAVPQGSCWWREPARRNGWASGPPYELLPCLLLLQIGTDGTIQSHAAPAQAWSSVFGPAM